jgi:hypothetical protein
MNGNFKLTYRYKAYNLNILSQFPITGFTTYEFSKPDVRIVEGIISDSLTNPRNKGIFFQSTENEFLLKIDNLARYYVCNGNKIVIQKNDTATWQEVSVFILGIIFGVLCHQRKLLPLHASTVIFKKKCILFMGLSGSGKSTTAAYFIRKGGMLVADDVSVLDYSGNIPLVLPAYPFIKIWEDSLHKLGVKTDELSSVRNELMKFYLPVKQFQKEPVPVDHIIVLHTHNKPYFERKEPKGINKFRLLKKHTYLFKGIPHTGLENNHFILTSRLARLIPITIITRPTGSFMLEELNDQVLQTTGNYNEDL